MARVRRGLERSRSDISKGSFVATFASLIRTPWAWRLRGDFSFLLAPFFIGVPGGRLSSGRFYNWSRRRRREIQVGHGDAIVRAKSVAALRARNPSRSRRRDHESQVGRGAAISEIIFCFRKLFFLTKFRALPRALQSPIAKIEFVFKEAPSKSSHSGL